MPYDTERTQRKLDYLQNSVLHNAERSQSEDFERLKRIIEREGYDSPTANLAGQVTAGSTVFLTQTKAEIEHLKKRLHQNNGF